MKENIFLTWQEGWDSLVGVELGVYLLGEATPELNPELNAEAWLVGVPAGDPPGLVEMRFPLVILLKIDFDKNISLKTVFQQQQNLL